MKIKHHALTSTIVAGVLYAVFRSWGLAIASFISGIFIDLDHIIDYWIEHGWRFNLKRFFNYFDDKNFVDRKRLFFIFHAWEWLLLLFFAAMLSNWDMWITGFLAGYAQHMILDEIYNSFKYRIRPFVWGYFLVWRWRNGFRFR